jgi:hypothetical protein
LAALAVIFFGRLLFGRLVSFFARAGLIVLSRQNRRRLQDCITMDNRSRQLNPQDKTYYLSRGNPPATAAARATQTTQSNQQKGATQQGGHPPKK